MMPEPLLTPEDYAEICGVLGDEAGHLRRQWLIGQGALEVGEMGMGNGWCSEALAGLGRLLWVAVGDLAAVTICHR